MTETYIPEELKERLRLISMKSDYVNDFTTLLEGQTTQPLCNLKQVLELELIINKVIESCAQARLNNAMDGGFGNDGTYASIQCLANFLNGYTYAISGKLQSNYLNIIKKHRLENDPDYKTYLDLKSKFKELES